MDIDQAFGTVRSALPSTAVFQGIHFKFASKGNVTILEVKRGERFFYWLIAEGEAKLIHASINSKLRSLQTIGASFTPSHAYASHLPPSSSRERERLTAPLTRSVGAAGPVSGAPEGAASFGCDAATGRFLRTGGEIE